MKLNAILVAVIFIFFFSGTLIAQGKYLNPAAQQEMDKPIITASSTLSPGSSSNYSPDNLMDGTEASWSEGAKGSGVGEFLQVDFRFPDEMKYVMIKNGFGKEKYWKANARIRKIMISNEEGDTRIINLEDTPDLQVVGLNYIEENEDMLMASSGGLYGSSFKFEILEVYPGDRWQDACITEMNFNQWHTNWFPMTEEYIYKNLYREYLNGVFDQSGRLYTESDWDGYVYMNVEYGNNFEEIVSGDGTGGYFAYQVFINQKSNEYYLLHSRYMRQIDYEQVDFNKEVQEKPVWVESFFWDFFKYDAEEAEFLSIKERVFNLLFDVYPVVQLSDISGKVITEEMLWLDCSKPGSINVECFECGGDEEPALIYTWKKNKIRLQQ